VLVFCSLFFGLLCWFGFEELLSHVFFRSFPLNPVSSRAFPFLSLDVTDFFWLQVAVLQGDRFGEGFFWMRKFK
jgi:hypothetical protein